MARDKKRSNRPRGHDAGKIWGLANQGLPYHEISDLTGYTVTAIKVYLNVKFKQEADLLWALEIKSVGQCELCLFGNCSGGLHAHHLIEKSTHPRLRYDLSNGICLCENHHIFSVEISPHKCSVSRDRFMEWLKADRPGQYQWFSEHKYDKAYQPVDYADAYFALAGKSGGDL